MQHPLSWIRSFEATARHGNFTRAAEELGLTQAAVSQHIKGLEERLGIQLFERQARGAMLSSVGAELYKSVAEGIGTIEAALERFSETNEARLHILCNTSLALNWLSPRLTQFLSQHPELDFRLSTALWQTDAIGVKADVSIFLAPTKEGKLKQIVGGDLIMVEPTDKSVPDLSVVQVVGFEKMFEGFRKSLDTDDVPPPRIIECDSFHIALQIVAAGGGRTIAPRLLANTGIVNGSLRDIGPCEFHLPMHYWAKLNSTKSTAARAFIDWVVLTAEKELR
jgi:DNA-binding transcriptional LysR family regulator